MFICLWKDKRFSNRNDSSELNPHHGKNKQINKQINAYKNTDNKKLKTASHEHSIYLQALGSENWP